MKNVVEIFLKESQNCCFVTGFMITETYFYFKNKKVLFLLEKMISLKRFRI